MSNERRTILVAVGISTLVFALIVSLRISGSSISMWYAYLAKTGSPKQHVLIGEPRAIRSDEWLVSTPTMLAYAEHLNSKTPKPDIADFAGAPGSEILMNQPVDHYVSIFRPQLWGFFFLDKEHAFSFYWASKVVGLLLVFFIVLFLLTESTAIALAGSTWFFLSSFVQWWFSTSLPEMITSALIATLGAWMITSSHRVSFAALGFFAIILGVINFVMFVYPPFLVPVAHACLGLLVCLILHRGFIPRDLWLSRVAILFLAGIACLIVFCGIWDDIAEVINAVRKTEYPGQRVSSPGSYPFSRYLAQWGDVFFSEARFPPQFGNVCEASGFLLLWPIVIPYFIWGNVKGWISRRDLLVLTPLVLPLLVHGAWMSISVPSWLSKTLGLTLSPPARTLVGPGILNVVILSMASASALKIHRGRDYPITLGALVVFVAILVGWKTESSVQGFFSSAELSLVSIAIASSLVGLVTARPILFWIPIIFLVVPNIWINPITRGLSPLLGNPLVKKAKTVRRQDPHARWAVYGDLVYANLLKVAGVRVFNGLSYVPRMTDYLVLDDAQVYTSVYNRYAKIGLQSPQGLDPSRFSLIQADTVIARIHPCDQALQKIGVRYLVFSYKPQEYEMSCLQPIHKGKIGGQFYLFRFRNDHQATD
jgi:hypothetical protein